jgi:hypothetical protein
LITYKNKLLVCTLKKEVKMKASDFLKKTTKVSKRSFKKRRRGISVNFTAMCDGDCGDGVCGQCD